MCILWFEDNDVNKEIVDYRFKRLLFGLNCSISIAEYCQKRTASDNKTNASVETVETVNSSFYVDDRLISSKSLEDKQIVAELIKLLQSGGFELKKFVPENPELLSGIDSNRLLHNGQARNLSDKQSYECKVLGLHWDPESCTISLKVDLKHSSETKRSLWGMIAQIFDPWGMCAHLLSSQQMLQQICEKVKGWDDPISPDIMKR